MTTPTETSAMLSESSTSDNATMDINHLLDKPMGLQSPDIVLATVSGFLVVIMVLANLVNVPYFVKGDGTCLKPFTLYIIGLMIADLGIASVCQTMTTVVVYLGRWPFSYVSCSIYDYFRLVLENTGVWIMVLISVDKLQLLTYDYPRYVRVKRKRRIVLEVVMTFITPMAFHLGGIILWIISTTEQERADDHSLDCQDIPAEIDIPFVVIGATINIFIPGIAIMVINSIVFYKIKQRMTKRHKVGHELIHAFTGPNAQGNRREPSSTNPTSSNSNARHRNNQNAALKPVLVNTLNSGLNDNLSEVSLPKSTGGNRDMLQKKNSLDTEYRRYIRPAVTLAGLVATFSICWFPFATYHVYVHVFCPSCFDITIQLWLKCLMYANSALNPFIFMATNRKIRKFHAKEFRKLLSWCNLCWH